jgi:Calx-beta domain/Domain of unknown function (DUF4214)
MPSLFRRQSRTGSSSRILILECLESRLNPGVIAFSQAAYDVANNAGTVTIQLDRSGDTRSTDTVNLASTNGTAVAPTDYTAVNGTITFVPSATQVSLQIIIHQNSQPGDRSFTLDLQSPSVSASLGTIVHATVNIVDTTSQNARFVKQLYQTLLDRTADLVGLAFYTNLLDTGTDSRQSVALGFLNSSEYRTLQINQLYQTILGRAADPGGLSFAVGELNQGATFEQIQAQFYASDEYFAKIGTGSPDNDQTRNWIDSLFTAALNRHAESSALAALAPTASQGTSGRTNVAVSILTSTEADRDRIEGYYQTILHRAGDQAGINSWVQQMQQGARDEDVEAAFLGSTEYFASV